MSRKISKAVALSATVAAAAVLAGCAQGGTGQQASSDSPSGTSTSRTDPQSADGGYVGPYNSEFYDALTTYEGEEVTVLGGVDEVVSPTSFTIAGTEDTQVGPLLVVALEATGGLEPDMVVSVTGTVHEALDVADVERRFDTNFDGELHSSWAGGPYIEALVIDLPAPEG